MTPHRAFKHLSLEIYSPETYTKQHPFALLENYAPDNNGNSIADNITIQAKNQTNGTTLSPFLQQVHHPTRCTDTQMVLYKYYATVWYKV
jgi:hypothetical protein